MLKQVYHSQAIQAWERRWFSQKNSSFGLMQQAAWQMTQYIIQCLQYKKLARVLQSGADRATLPEMAIWRQLIWRAQAMMLKFSRLCQESRQIYIRQSNMHRGSI